jgi:hypothetical protein
MVQTRHIIKIVLNSSTKNVKKIKEIMSKSKPSSSKSKDADIMKVVSYLTEQKKPPTQAELKEVSCAIKYMEGEYMPSVISGVVKRISNPKVTLADIKQYIKTTLKDKNDYRWLLLKKHMNHMIKISTKEKNLKQRFESILNHITKHLKKQIKTTNMAMKGGSYGYYSPYDDDGPECEYVPDYTISLDKIKTDDNQDHIFRCHNNLKITKDDVNQVTPAPAEYLEKVKTFIAKFHNLTSLRVDGLREYFTLDMLEDLPSKKKLEMIFMKDTTAADDFKQKGDDGEKAALLDSYGLTELELVKYDCGQKGVWVRDCVGEYKNADDETEEYRSVN